MTVWSMTLNRQSPDLNFKTLEHWSTRCADQRRPLNKIRLATIAYREEVVELEVQGRLKPRSRLGLRRHTHRLSQTCCNGFRIEKSLRTTRTCPELFPVHLSGLRPSASSWYSTKHIRTQEPMKPPLFTHACFDAPSQWRCQENWCDYYFTPLNSQVVVSRDTWGIIVSLFLFRLYLWQLTSPKYTIYLN